MTDTAACLLTMARPQYLNKCISSLENCKDKDEVDWYIFQDGAVNTFSGERLVNDRGIELVSNIIEKANLPNKTIERNDENLGIPLQFSKAFSLLDEGYDRVIIFEDDLVVGENAISLMMRLLDEFPESCPSIYRSPKFKLPDEIDIEPDVLIKSPTASFKSVGINRDIYDSIKERRGEYMSMVDNVDYRARDHEEIKDKFESRVSSHDSVMNKLLKEEGYRRIKPAVTRGINIGVIGLHTNTKGFTEKGRHDSINIDAGVPDRFRIEEVDRGLL